jgi:hypothetical protein
MDLSVIYAIVHDREDHEAAIHGRTLNSNPTARAGSKDSKAA